MNSRQDIDSNKGIYIKADLISRPNATNGNYRKCQLYELETEYLVKVKDNDIFFLETLQRQANLADKMIAETEEAGKDISDLNVMKELGAKIKVAGKPIQRSESVMTAIFVSLQLIFYYGIAIGIWSLVLKKSFLLFGLTGAIIGFLISILLVVPIIVGKRTKENIRNTVSGVGLSIGNFGIVIGIVGLIAWIIRLIFF